MIPDAPLTPVQMVGFWLLVGSLIIVGLLYGARRWGKP